jgi:imidazolonepropionase
MATNSPLLLRDLAQAWDGFRLVDRPSVVVEGPSITWFGPEDEGPSDREILARGGSVHRAGGALMTPGLVDCHTHAIFGGSRLGDFLRRQGGATYTELLEAGGGIHHTVRQTAAESGAALRAALRQRLDGMLAGGVTTVEVKGGYGLDVVYERRLLELANSSGSAVEVVPTFLGAHAIPPGQDRGAYVDLVCGPMLEACAPLARAIDVYCDRGAFTLEESVRILAAGKARGLGVRAHAEQVSHTGIAAAAARMGAWSCDHLEHVDDEGIGAMAAAGTVAVLLPGAMLYLHDAPPPVERLRAAGVRLAIATDFNPGSSPVRDLWTCATLACVCLGVTAEEALAGITSGAGAAAGIRGGGVLAAGAAADLALFHPPPGECSDVRVLVQYMGGHRAAGVMKAGAWVA